MGIPLLTDILIILALGSAVLFICHRLRISTVVGFLLTGILAGPHGLALVSAVHDVEVLAEVGIILLLFTIGLEFSLKDLLQIRRTVLVGGALQVSLTVVFAYLIGHAFGLDAGEAIFAGFLASLSSTAIVLKILQDRAELESPHGRTTFGVLIFQDIIIVPMMLVTPLLAGGQGGMGGPLLMLVLKAAGIIVFVIVSAKFIIPWLLFHIARTRSRELFLTSIAVICLAVAFLTSSLGLSLALGAFLAGLTISESEYSHQALGSALPFRDVFTSFFFVSVGMLLDIHILFREPAVIGLLTVAVLGLKLLAAGLAVLLLGFPIRIAIITGLALSQVGEFSFILSKVGVEYGLLDGQAYQLFLAVSILTMAATPWIMAVAPHLGDMTKTWPLPTRLKSGFYPVPGLGRAADKVTLKDHIIIVGFGINGRNVAQAARINRIPYLIIEMNPETVRKERELGEPIMYGDAIQEGVLEHVRIGDAKVLVVAIADPVAIRRITSLARRMNPSVYIIARTRFVQEMKPLHELGADEVIPEEFETSVQIFARVLRKYLIPQHEIDECINDLRAGGYETFRRLSVGPDHPGVED